MDWMYEPQGLEMTPISNARRWLYYFGQDQERVSWAQRIRAVIGAFIGLFLVVLIGKFFGDFIGVREWIIASLGASALLIFVLPSSPMAQPWAVVTGNVISALVGVVIVRLTENALIALPCAVAFAILGMFLLRCLHPPAAAVALIAVMGQIDRFQFAFFPVLIDSAVLCFAGFIYNSLTGKQYPVRPSSNTTKILKGDSQMLAEATQKVNALLDQYQEVIDIDRAELIKFIELGYAQKEKEAAKKV